MSIHFFENQILWFQFEFAEKVNIKEVVSKHYNKYIENVMSEIIIYFF